MKSSLQMSSYVLAGYSVFGMMSLGMMSFGVACAQERDSGLLRIKQAQPMPPGAYFGAKLLVAMLFSAVISVLLQTLAITATGVDLSLGQSLALLLLALFGVLPFCALGLALGSCVSGSAAVGLINLVYLPMAVLSGLWFPLQILPPFVQRIAPLWPSWHADQLAMHVLGLADAPVLSHVLVLAAYAVLFLSVAIRRMAPEARGRAPQLLRLAMIGSVLLIAFNIKPGTGGEPGSATAQTAASPVAGSGTPDFAIRDVRVFDGDKVLEHANVIVHDGLIQAVGADAAIDDRYRVVDGQGRTLLPGLIDAHVHAFLGARHDALRFGVTTELDMMHVDNHFADWRREREGRARTDEADLWSAGYAATVPGGHGTEYGFDVPTLTRADQAEAFVAARVADGSDYLKIILDDGSAYGHDHHLPTLDDATLQALVKAAHAQHRMVLVHVSTQADARRALAAGADGLAHAFIDQVADDDLIKRATQPGRFMVPTLTVYASIAHDASTAALLQDPAIAPGLSAEQQQMLGARFPLDVPRALTVAMQNVRVLHEAGMPILAGTDAGNPGTAHGVSEHQELALLVRAGLSPQQALAAATSVPAKVFGLKDRGRIAPGLRADLLLVDGDPTQHISDSRRIVRIWKNGYAVDRALPSPKTAAASPALAAPLLADFENGAQARVGSLSESTDRLAGGKSEVTLSVVDSGDGGHALHLDGDVRKGFAWPWSGMVLVPAGDFQKTVDASAAKALHLRVRGDGHPGAVMIFAGPLTPQPQITVPFTSTQDWQDIIVALADHPGVDFSQLRAISVAATAPAGHFAMDIDDVSLR